ncbi:uncharacterized protein LOC127711546 isoform X2 [Mytilus californianus]|uniref:uncharacterized protein LOC127711546 isoform X2 n=1 Tax=Mytilus californianus TaxID=6549 RepID=UPI0022472F25|nr:uncharacterized protein LOC127711546 isoform X2 [Mytilus californianus]
MLKIKLRSRTRKTENKQPSNASYNEGKQSATQQKSNKQKMVEYRQRLKESPDTYQAYLASEAERNKAYRANLTEEKRATQRELTRLRVKRFREKKKTQLTLNEPNKSNDNVNDTTPKTPQTRQKVKGRREYWRKKKQDQRQNMTAQKKRRINERRRQKYAEKKGIKILDDSEKQQSLSSVSPGYITKEAERKAIYRAKKSLPTSPNKFASVLSGIAAMATPRKRAALDKNGTVMTPSKRRRLKMYDETVGKIIAEVKNKKYRRSKIALRRRRVLASSILWSRHSSLRKQYCMSWTFAHKCSTLEGVWDNKKRSDALDQNTIKAVEDFFKRPANSTYLPDKKHVSKKTLEPKIILDKSLQDTYKQFREQNQECNISFSKFSSLRPSNVKTMNKNTFNNCLCEYCTNIELKIKAISKVLGNRTVVKDRYDISRQTLCPKLDGMQFCQKKCIERECEQCGTGPLKTSLAKLLKNKCKSLEWHKWENQTFTDKDKKKTRKMLKLRKDHVDVFIRELMSEIEPFSGHIHNAAWQHEQFSKVIRNIPDKWVIFCMDFAENYTCLYQDEAQSAHWSHNTVTLFSIVAYYYCPSCQNPMNESMMFITEDKKHDSHAVHHFVGLANTYLKDKGIGINREIHFSDGAPGQFKSKTPFADVSKSNEDYGFPVEKHFFGTRHGKGPCDGEFGVVKRSVSNSILARSSIVSDAEDFYKYASDELSIQKGEEDDCCHKIRSFFLVDKTDVIRKRQDRIEVKAVPDTRKKHAIKPVANGNLVTRLLSCFCDGCVTQNGECMNKEHVDSWEGINKQKKTAKPKSAQSNKSRRKVISNGNQNNAKPAIKRKKQNKKSRPRGKRDVAQNRDKSICQKTIDTTLNVNMNGKAEEIHELPSINTADLPCDRRGFYRVVLLYLQSARSFNELQAKCIEINELPNFKGYTLFVDKNIDMVTYNLTADGQALDLIPKDALHPDFTSWLPVQVIGDGNCLPRSASVACFGTETDHQEIRARIVIEMCLHVEKYTSNEYLNRGIDLPKKEAENLRKSYTMFSEQYTAGDKITNAVINRVYQAEALEAVKSGNFMGIWQLFALSSCLNSVIDSIYPKMGYCLPKLTLHREILPRANIVQMDNQAKFVVMWSSTRTDMTRENWIPNHFVPLIPPYQSNIDFLDDHDENDGFAIDDSVMITLLQTVTGVTFDDDHYTTDELAVETSIGEKLTVDVDRPWDDDQSLDAGTKTETAHPSNVSSETSGDQPKVVVFTTRAEQLSEVSTLNYDQTKVDDSINETEQPSEVSALKYDQTKVDGSTNKTEQPSEVSALKYDQNKVNSSTNETEQPSKVSALNYDQTKVDGSTNKTEQPSEVSALKNDQTKVNGLTNETDQPSKVSALNFDQTKVDGSINETEQPSEVSALNYDQTKVDGSTNETEQPSEVSALKYDQTKVNSSTNETEQPSKVSALNYDQTKVDGATNETEQPSEVSALNYNQTKVDGSTNETEQPSEVSALNYDQTKVDGSTNETEQSLEVSTPSDDQLMVDNSTTDDEQPYEVSALDDDQHMADGSLTQTTRDSEQIEDKEKADVALHLDVDETEKVSCNGPIRLLTGHGLNFTPTRKDQMSGG